MTLHVVELGSDRKAGEGLRIGTVRRPPRGVKKSDFERLNWFDIWLPILAPSEETLKKGQAANSEREWKEFERLYRKEMSQGHPLRVIELLAAMSHISNFLVGCYGKVEQERCHRSILRKLLSEHCAKLA